MAGNIKAIIFDFGGVLLKWNPRKIFYPYFPEGKEAIDNFFSKINFDEWNTKMDQGVSFAEGVNVLSMQFPQFTEPLKAYQEHWEDSIDGPILENISLLHELKQKGYSLFGLSNWSSETFPIVRKRFEFFELFDGMIISGEVKLVKPDPDIFLRCLTMVAKPASECLFIDDSEPNVKTAVQMGFDSIHFISPKQLREDLISRNLI
jgi:2-haloacid dehalogenase